MHFLIMGCGSIGERHIANLKDLDKQVTIDAFDPQEERLEAICKKYSINPVEESAVDRTPYDAVLICTPPVTHTGLALRVLNAGSNVFIEKPISSSVQDTDKVKDLASAKQLRAFVGYNFRFNRGIKMVKSMVADGRFGKIIHASAYFGQYLPDWRPWQNYKNSYTARKDLGGGIIHDGSHEINYLVWLIGKIPTHIQCQFAHTDILTADTEAVSDILLRFDSKLLGYIHLDFIRREYRRNLEILCEEGIIQWSLSEDVVRTYDASSKSWNVVKLNENVNDMYKAEMNHVIECLKNKKNSAIIDLEDGIHTLMLCDAALKSGESGRRLSL